MTTLPTRTIGTDPARTRTVSCIALGAMLMGTRTDEATSFAILDRYVEAGGSLVDTSNNYAFWVDGTRGGESESLLGRWLRDRGIGDEISVATKMGARPDAPGKDITARMERQSAGLLGVSNHWTWSVERARALAAARGLPSYDVLQYAHTYLRPRTDQPYPWSPEGSSGAADGNVLSYVAATPGTTLVAYSPLLGGAYVRDDKPVGPQLDHPGTTARRTALAEVAAATGATPNQVVLSWLLGGGLPVVPLVGASSVAQLDETLAAASLELTADQRHRLDTAGTG
ncbi:aldo/keto reductase [uncultured Nocardioides sp.]|uniref:Aldo/keto reductase, SCO7087 family n=1 Tax=uncultured Nocardioides sp. TaxID=198441 RepID=A0A6J4NC40_9ACTN|nr:aldo/keto reductase [uncultured Nocardioides sp.]CAA9383787.1 MAG: Aldo/keto reductase, SCO7087 family [uncultured Nocardioides sp.]